MSDKPRTDEEFLEFNKDFMVKAMLSMGELMPQFALDGPEGLLLVATPELGDPELKPMIYEYVKSAIKEGGVTRYAVMMEAWAAVYGVDEEPLVPPRKSDRRIEVLSCIVVTRERVLHWTGEIVRNDKGGFAGVENERTAADEGHHAGAAVRLFDD